MSDLDYIIYNMLFTTKINKILENAISAQADHMISNKTTTLTKEEFIESATKFYLGSFNNVVVSADGDGAVKSEKRAKKKSAIELWASDNRPDIDKFRDENKVEQKGEMKPMKYMAGRGAMWKTINADTKKHFTDLASAQ